MHRTRHLPFSRFAGAIAAALVAVGLAPAAANAAVELAAPKLTIREVDRGESQSDYDVVVTGRLFTSEVGESERLIASRHHFQVRLWGEDPIWDDLIRGPVKVIAKPAGTALDCEWSVRVSSNTLNEDPLPTDGDEIYASVRFVDSAGKQIKSRQTNRIRRYFGHI